VKLDKKKQKDRQIRDSFDRESVKTTIKHPVSLSPASPPRPFVHPTFPSPPPSPPPSRARTKSALVMQPTSTSLSTVSTTSTTPRKMASG
jgi:hypothetical protein